MNDQARMSEDDYAAERRWWELAAGEPLGDLDAEETSALSKPPREVSPEEARQVRLEAARTVAALDVAASAGATLPAGLRNRLVARGRAEISPVVERPTLPSSQAMGRREMMAWFTAGAAAIAAIAVSVSRTARPKGDPIVKAPTPKSPSELRQEFLVAREQSGALARGEAKRLEWTATENPSAQGAAGDVVWDNAAQSGYLRFQGLVPNDPTQSQYQLWIFDAQQQHPIDGGVFDVGVDGEGETVVSIDAKLRVAEPTLFAVTIEKPGGVVVSDQKRIALVAKWAASSP